MANITPSPAMLQGLRNQNLAWHIILGEFIDNAFDAAATRVEINFNNRRLEIIDNGKGCPDPLRLLRLGAHHHQTTTSLGVYGVGAKEAASSAADTLYIETVHRGVRRSLRCDWNALQRSTEWIIDDPVSSPTTEPDGTRLVLEPTRNTEGLRANRRNAIIKQLSLQYTPGIKQGRQILFNGKPVPLYAFPPLEYQTTEHLEVNGLTADVTMGVVKEGHVVTDSGLLISYGFRVIKEKQRLGLGQEPTPSLVGSIELGSGWRLTKNKNDIASSTSLDPLAAVIAVVFRQVIELARRRGQLLRFGNVTESISRILNDFLTERTSKRRKAKRRSPEEESGAILPKDSGRRHRRAARIQPGDTFDVLQSGGICHGLNVSFANLGEAGPQAQVSGNTILLNSALPLIGTDPEHHAPLAAINVAANWFVHQMRAGNLPFPPDVEEARDEFELSMKIAGELLSRLHIDISSAQTTTAG